jgi:hypothetical protein
MWPNTRSFVLHEGVQEPMQACCHLVAIARAPCDRHYRRIEYTVYVLPMLWRPLWQ